MAAFRNLVFLIITIILCLCERGAVTSAQMTEPPAPEPEPEPTMRVKPEAEKPYGEPEHDPEGEPKGEPEGVTPEPDRPFAEPVPVWEDAFPRWKAAWEIHIYGMGVLFALLAIYSLISIIRLRKKRLLSRGYFVALNLMMLTMGVDRAVYLLVDAYNHKLIWPAPVAYLLIGLGFPCLTSAFSILFLALLQSTRTQIVPPKIQQPKYLAVVIFIHFSISIASDVIVGFFGNAQALLLVCQGAFLIWGISLSISYLIIFRRLYKSSVRQFREITRLSMSRRSINMKGVAPYMKKPQNRWGNAIKVTVVTSLMGLVTAGLQLYGASVVYGPFATEIPKAWPWWSYQFIFRVAEFIMCALMSFVATQPFRYTSDGREKPCTVPCRGVLRWFCCGCNTADHEIKDAGEDSLWNTNLFESAQLDSDGNPIPCNAVSVGLDPLDADNHAMPISENGQEKTKDFNHSPPRSPDSMSPIMEYSTNQNANSSRNTQKRLAFNLNEEEGNQINSTENNCEKSPSMDGSAIEQENINTNSNNSRESSPIGGRRPTDDAEANMPSVSDNLLASSVNNRQGQQPDKAAEGESAVHLLDNTTGEVMV